ncbi:MAG: efflux RND transporter periplasmic adaptor subunit [Gammaproteobacteria bacterium]|nr:efflux RND transporter periplasmic adaptor subunit [Gammaproteobacteria bacterium]
MQFRFSANQDHSPEKSWLHTIQLGLIGVCMVVYPVLFVACAKKTEPPIPASRVLVTTISSNAMGEEERFNGTFMPRIQTMLSFRASGKVINRYVEVGDIVKQGTVLARLDGEDYGLAEQTAQQQVVAARADSEQAAREEARLKNLVADGTVSRSEYEQVLSKKIASAAVTAQAEKQLNLNQNKVSYLNLVAPQSGVISDIRFEVGQIVGEGQPVATLSDQSEMELAVDLPDYMVKDINAWRAHAKFWPNDSTVDSTTPPQDMELKLRRLSPVASGMSQSFEARYTLVGLKHEAMAQLKQGMSAQVVLQRITPSAGITLPSGAVGKTNASTFVWVVTKDHHLKRVPVNVVRFAESTIQVTGLTNGMQVVTVGIQKLDDNMTVEAIERPLEIQNHEPDQPQSADAASSSTSN